MEPAVAAAAKIRYIGRPGQFRLSQQRFKMKFIPFAALGAALIITAVAAREPLPEPTGAELEMGVNVDVIRHKLFEAVAARVRDGVPSAAVAISVDTHGVQVIVHDRSKLRNVQDVLERTNAERRGTFTISHVLPGRFSINLSNAGRKNAIRGVESVMFETVRRGLRELGIANASVRLQSDDGLHADLPGYTDLGALQKKFGAPPSLTCMFVVAVPEADLRAWRHPDGTNLYPRRPTAADPHPAPVATYFDEAFSAADIRDVRVEADPRGRLAVSIHLDNAGRNALANAERNYPHSPMAIILDDMAVSTPIARRMPLFDGVKIVGLTQAEADGLASELSAATAIPPYTIYRLNETYGARTL